MGFACINSGSFYMYFEPTLCQNDPGKNNCFIYLFTVKLEWLEHLWDYGNMFETGVVRANECKA